jgi:hypothetical protein
MPSVARPKETKMTKKAEQAEEKKLVWKFKDLPSAGAIASLVEQKVITAEEARGILFKEEVKQSDEVEALKEMVNALKDMVKDLLSRQNNVTLVPYTKVIEVPTRIRPYFDRYWMNSSGTTLGGYVDTTTSSTNGTTTYTMSVN